MFSAETVVRVFSALPSRARADPNYSLRCDLAQAVSVAKQLGFAVGIGRLDPVS